MLLVRAGVLAALTLKLAKASSNVSPRAAPSARAKLALLELAHEREQTRITAYLRGITVMHQAARRSEDSSSSILLIAFSAIRYFYGERCGFSVRGETPPGGCRIGLLARSPQSCTPLRNRARHVDKHGDLRTGRIWNDLDTYRRQEIEQQRDSPNRW